MAIQAGFKRQIWCSIEVPDSRRAAPVQVTVWGAWDRDGVGRGQFILYRGELRLGDPRRVLAGDILELVSETLWRASLDVAADAEARPSGG